MTDTGVARQFIATSRDLLGVEYRVKLRAALDALPPDALWWRADAQSNSVGNLLLHLAGNVRQWIVGGVGGRPVERHRDAEFTAAGGSSIDDLWANLDAAIGEADAVIAGLDPAHLLERRTIQAREVTVLDAVYHVVEHFGMHLGQIILIAKMRAPGAVKFYEDAGGLARPLWREGAERFRTRDIAPDRSVD